MAKKEELDNIAGNEKLRALQAAMDKIEKSFGKGSIMKLGDDNFEDVDVIPTGSVGLNAALGVGGLMATRQTLKWHKDYGFFERGKLGDSSGTSA